MAQNSRIQAFDWLRGIAVLVMIQTHALSLLRPELRNGPLWMRLQWIDGLVAPAFIFSAGFSLALVQVRGASGGARWPRLRKTLRRLGEVLLVATLVNWMWFPLLSQPRWIFRIDILHCIGLSLLLALPILAALAHRPLVLRWVALGLAAVAFGASPLAERVHGPLAALANGSTGSVFPLLPWAGYVYLGASAGATAAAGDAKALARWVAGLLAAGVVLWLLTPQMTAIYPLHEFWVTNPANHARRWTQVCAVVLVLMAAERSQGRWRASAPVRFVEVFGTSSLAGYFFHQMLLYKQIGGFSFDAVWGKRCDWTQYALLTAVLIACTFVLTWVTDRVYRRAWAGFGAPTAVQKA
ncbi:MAG TPA: heparan-alpha-glucosaminide N-acetyltransferase domain-containing protein [Myxococcales bacterium]|nr:heparan-alpha-glucosaminide N-acetyltransferase domain-containing protein [Myxococcales bacterium]